MCLSVNNCCCCITLSVGTKIIGILSTVTSLICTVVFGWSALLGSTLPPSRLWFYGCMAATALVQCVFGCFLIYGAFTHKPKYTVPWSALTWSQALTLAVLAVTGTVLLSYNRGHDSTADISAVISVYFLYALILFYCASVVNSRRQQMLIEDRTEASKKLMRHRVLPHVVPNYYV